jgi:hypothetical protein
MKYLSDLTVFQIVIPPWPTYNQHPVKWAPTVETKKQQ